MMVGKELSLVVGCGPQGAEWIASQQDGSRYIGLDNKVTPTGQLAVCGDVLYLPFQDQAFKKVQSDFVLNGMVVREPGISEVRQNPQILATKHFPPLVNRWFIEGLQRSPEGVRRNIADVAKLLRVTAFREMWRVLTVSGEMELLDFDYNTSWIANFAANILAENPSSVMVKSLSLSEDDFKRSASLQKVSRGSTVVQKIKLTKARDYRNNLPVNSSHLQRELLSSRV